MTERLRIAALWVVVAALAILALLAPRSTSAPASMPAPAVRRIVPTIVPAAVADAPNADRTAAVLDALASGATCDDRLAAVARLRTAGDPAAIPALTRAARADRCVAAAARDAIRALGRTSDDARW